MDTSNKNAMQEDSCSCRYCDGFLHEDAPYRSVSCNTKLIESRNFVVVPTIGMIIPGWLLILTKHHIPNMASIPLSWYDEMNELLQKAKTIVSSCFAPPYVFEHGAAPQQHQTSGSCVNHAHLHLIPSIHPVAIEKDILRACNFVPVHGLAALRGEPFAKTGYLYYVNTAGQTYAGPAADVPSQLIRRIVAAHAQKSDQWNWAMFPEKDNILLTLDTIQLGDMP